MKTLILTALVAATTLFSCKCQSKASKSKETISTTSETSTSTKETVFDIIVMFISKGAGIDSELKGKIDTDITTFNKENGTNVKPEIAPWGREGERDYLFQTKNLSTKQKSKLITKFNNTIGSSTMARVILDKKSVHKR